jgi:hypothetical protein
MQRQARQMNAGTSGKGKDKGCRSARHDGTRESGVSLTILTTLSQPFTSFSKYRTENWDQTELTIDPTPWQFDDDDNDDNDVVVAEAARNSTYIHYSSISSKIQHQH